MKKLLKILGVILFLFVAYLVVLQVYPKNAGRFPFLAILFFGDVYLYASVKTWIKGRKRFYRNILRISYWIPLALLVLAVLVTMLDPGSINDQLRIYLFGFVFIAYAAKLLPIIFLLFADFINGVRYVNHKVKKSAEKSGSITAKGEKMTRSRFLQKAGLVSGGLMFGGLLTGMLKWVYDFKIRRETIRLHHLPASFNGLKIVQISDIHLGSWAATHPLEEVVTLINRLQPDLIFFTGDLVNYKTEEAYRFENILNKLHAKSGIFATLGNHDYGDYTRWPSQTAKMKNLTDLYDFFGRMGWKVLNNENHLITHSDGQLAIIGVENWGAYSRFPKYGDIEKAAAGTGEASVKLLLSHDPTHWDVIISKKYTDIDITFAGHTHGFQFGIDTRRVRWSPAQWVYKHWAGLYQNPAATAKPQYLYVNRGLGTIGYPGRVGILPEITLFELTS
jgi:predicted MPP superfamily phosphohydrolase